MSDQVMQIATRLKALREISDYTVAEAAAATGVSEAEYSAYESGSVDIPISFLLKFSALFGVDTTTVLTGEAPRLSVCALTRKNMGVDITRAEHYIYKNLAYNFNHRKVEPLLVTVVPATPDGNEQPFRARVRLCAGRKIAPEGGQPDHGIAPGRFGILRFDPSPRHAGHWRRSVQVPCDCDSVIKKRELTCNC